MSKTVVGIFESTDEAQQAKSHLLATGLAVKTSMSRQPLTSQILGRARSQQKKKT